MKSLALVTYAKKAQVQIILDNHKNAIEAYAFIEHNKEKGEIHNHIFVKFNTDRKGTDILKWFENFYDKEFPHNEMKFKEITKTKRFLNRKIDEFEDDDLDDIEEPENFDDIDEEGADI